MADYKFVEKKQEGEITIISLKINSEVFVTRKEKVFNRLAKNIKITGFRPGKAPKAMIEARLGADLYEQTLNELLPDVTYEYITNEKIEFLGRISYQVTKVSEAEGVEFTVSFITYPEIKLPNVKKIKVKKEKEELTEEEVEAELQNILKFRDSQSGKDSTKKEEKKKITDEEVEALGLGLKKVDELKDLIRKQLETQKENIARSKQIQKVVDEAIEKAKFEAPKIMVDQEVAKKEHDYRHRIEDLGLKLDDFLETQKTTMEELKTGWKQEAEKQIRTDLLLFEIAKAQELKVTNEEINAEIEAISDPQLKEQYDNLEGRNYVSSIILQQKAINWLAQEVGITEEKTKSEK